MWQTADSVAQFLDTALVVLTVISIGVIIARRVKKD